MPRKPPPLKAFVFEVGSGKRIVRIMAVSSYAAKQQLATEQGLAADGTRYKLIRTEDA